MFLPADLVAQLSPKLHALVHNGFKESEDGVANWENEDREVFFRFGDFAYKGYYQAHRADAVPTLEDELKVSQAQAWDIADEERELRRLEGKKKKKGRLSLAPERRRLERLISKAEHRERRNEAWWAEEAASAASGNSGLVHAQLYVFADYHAIEGLKCMSLECLGRLLRVSNMSNSIRGKFAELVRYALENIPNCGAQADPLIDLILTYCIHWYDYLIDEDDFQELLAQGLAVPLLKKIRPVKSRQEFRDASAESMQLETTSQPDHW